jgi:integrase
MTRFKLKYVDRFTDRNGHERHYFRRDRGPRIPLPGLPGSSEFMAAYQVALDGGGPSKSARRQRGAQGTFDALAQLYFDSTDYSALAPSTRGVYRKVIDALIQTESIGHRRVDQVSREHIARMMTKRAETPAAANDVLIKLRLLIRCAIAHGWRKDDPTQGIKRFGGGEHHTWTEEEIAAFEARWPLGTVERTAFALLLFTGQRLSDASRMSWRDIESGGIQVVQQKTKTRLWVPVHTDLAGVLAVWPRAHVSILVTRYGKPYGSHGLGTKLAGSIAKAGLPTRCVVHGLRKAAARRLADAGCTVHQIMAITGHRSLKEVERYTRAAEQRRLAFDAMARLQNKDSQP